MAQPQTLPMRRRDKPVLSCIFCRGRKLRCDRQSPCSGCVQRGKAAQCTYSSSEQERKDAIDYRPRHSRSQQVRQRVARLETLVTEMRDAAQGTYQPLANAASPSAIFNDSGSSSIYRSGHGPDSVGELSSIDAHTVYTGSSHWATILEDIRHLREELSNQYSDSPEVHASPDRISLLRYIPPLSSEQILAMVPPRKVVDRHISQFFNAFDMAPTVVDRNEFLTEYTKFWENPSATPIMWVGLLFSIMSASALQQESASGLGGSSTSEPEPMLSSYRALTIHCLIAGDYLRPVRYTMETLIIHFGVEQTVNVDSSTESWILIGVIIRIALRMGLHRDPSHWTHIQPRQAERRRRLWITLYQMDFFTSTQVGLPRIIKDSQCDTRLPRHLLDHDPGLDHEVLRPEQPPKEPTPLLYIVQRHAIIKVAAEIYDATEAGLLPSTTVDALQTKLELAIDAIPACLKYKSLETSVAEKPITILHQIILDILIFKATYLLHQQILAGGAAAKDGTKSDDQCVEAALSILAHQQMLFEETQPGGLMFSVRWKVASSLNHEFLQATMMLCLALVRLNKEHEGICDSRVPNRQNEMAEALTRARDLWGNIAGQSVEAQKAANAITAALQHGSNDACVSSASELPIEFLDHAARVGVPEYFAGFEYEQDLAMDPYPGFFAMDDDTAES